MTNPADDFVDGRIGLFKVLGEDLALVSRLDAFTSRCCAPFAGHPCWSRSPAIGAAVLWEALSRQLRQASGESDGARALCRQL